FASRTCQGRAARSSTPTTRSSTLRAVRVAMVYACSLLAVKMRLYLYTKALARRWLGVERGVTPTVATRRGVSRPLHATRTCRGWSAVSTAVAESPRQWHGQGGRHSPKLEPSGLHFDVGGRR